MKETEEMEEEKKRGTHRNTMCRHVFVCFINRISVMRYWWGRNSKQRKREEKKRRATNRKE